MLLSHNLQGISKGLDLQHKIVMTTIMIMTINTERVSYLNIIITRLQVKVQKGEGDVMRGGHCYDGHTSEVVGIRRGKVGRVDDSARCCVVTVTHCTIINK